MVPWITVSVCALATFAYAIAASGLPMPFVTGEAEVRLGDPVHIVGLGARSTPLVADAGEAWRLLTCHFVHTSWMHLGFNLAFLFGVGAAIEQVVRRSDYAALVLFTAIASAMGSLLGTPQVSAGASGVVFGVLGAAVTVGVRHRPRLGRRVRRYFGLWVLPFLVIVFAFGLSNPSVDQASHLGGLLAGLAAGSVLELRRPGAPAPSDPPYPFVAATSITLVAVLAAPIIARGGQAPRRVRLANEVSVEVPGTWIPRARDAAVGSHEFVTAGGMVVLAIEDVPEGIAERPAAWYEAQRRPPSQASLPSVRNAIAIRDLVGEHARYHFKRGHTPMVRDVYVLQGQGDDGAARSWTLLSFETPLTWTDKYAPTRRSILASLRHEMQAAGPITFASLR